ncbi:MAG: Lon protease 2 [Verrucomicrobiae bacterium]|nr:Lon protease 2 [Verrucomicrobiae bacterium]
MNVPDTVAVMPLPNSILFPRVLLPLYIFEPRYRRMLADCLRGERLFSVALRRSSGQPYPIAGVGLVRTCLAQPDGTSNLVLEGVARVQILEYIQLKPYRIARVAPCESFAPTPPARAALVQAVERLAQARAKLGTELPRAVLDSLLAIEDAAYLTDLVSSTLLDDCRQKQRLLETLNVTDRLDQLVQLLHRQIRQFELWQKLQGDLPTDHVGRN